MGEQPAPRHLRAARHLPLIEPPRAGAPTLDFPALEPTYTVSELAEEVREILGEAFRGFWIRGEVHRPRSSARGHLYFELVEKGEGDRIVGKIDAVAWRRDHERIRRQLARSDQRLDDGVAVRCFGQIDFYPPAGRLQLVVREVDGAFGLGELERRRRETLAALAAADLLERNGRLALPDLPLRLALVTSHDSAAYHDFLTGLAESGYGFEVLLLHSAVQGRSAEEELIAALEAAGSAASASASPALAPLFDAVVLIRGGGSRSDLLAFDSRGVAEAVARCPLPVVCGLGHEIDSTIADLVCHTSVKTPTKAAELLVTRVADSERRLEAVADHLERASERCLARAHEAMGRAGRLASMAEARLAMRAGEVREAARRLSLLGRLRLRESRRQSEELARLLVASSTRSLDRQRPRADALAARVAALATARLERQKAVLDGLERLCHGLEPQRLLERGYSITRDASGQIVQNPDQVRSGDVLISQLAGGELVSRVEDLG